MTKNSLNWKTHLPAVQAELMHRAETSLRTFVKAAWHVLEPSTDFCPNWHLDAICDHLAAVSRGEIRNLLINIPPRHMKSLGANVFFPAWIWAQNPNPTNDPVYSFRVRKVAGVVPA